MSRYKYHIEIQFNNSYEQENLLYKGLSYNENGRPDFLEISNKSIHLICERSKDKELSSIITNYKSTINIQLSKAISYLAGVNGSKTEIESIIIKKFDRGELIDTFNYNNTNINQPLTKPIPKEYLFNNDELKVLFDGSKKSYIILIAISYWIKAVTAQQPGERFDRLWTGFNSIYSYLGSKNDKEIDKLADVRKFILKNKNFFSTSASIFDTYDEKKIRELHWRDLILNDHNTINKTKSFYYFIKRYSDYRINQVFKQTLPYRKDYLSRENLLTETEEHINKKIESRNKNNSEVLAFYTLKYSYFIRNKYFHGEKMDPTFHLIKNDDISELELINEILIMFIKDLISCNKHY